MRLKNLDHVGFSQLLRGLVLGISVLTIAPLTSAMVNAAPQSANLQAELSNSLGAQPKQSPKKDEKLVKLESNLKDVLTKGIGASAVVKCPGSVKFVSGRKFDCQATAEGKSFLVEIKPTSNSGAYEFQTKGLLRLVPLEEQIVSTIKQKNGVDVTANCGGGKVRIVKAKEVFTCQVRAASGETKKATVTVEDIYGNVKWKV